MKCFRNELTSTYIEYMGTKLQRKRFESTYVHIPSNLPRNKSNECLWSNESAKSTVAKYLNDLDYYKFCNDCLDSPHDLLAGFNTSNGLRDGNKTTLPRNFLLYGHVHMAQTRGSDLNGALALNYERVCGHKGYSYDAFQANERFWKNPASIDSVGHSFPTHSRLRVPYEIMDEMRLGTKIATSFRRNGIGHGGRHSHPGTSALNCTFLVQIPWITCYQLAIFSMYLSVVKGT
jgi:hypothetical protein